MMMTTTIVMMIMIMITMMTVVIGITIIQTLQYIICWMIFKNSFPNIKLKSTTTQDSKNIIKSLKTKNTYWYNKIPTDLLKTIISTDLICKIFEKVTLFRHLND